MRILVACEESQAVTTELRRLGHEAYSCDIIECSGGHPEWHIMQDVLKIINPEYYDGRFGITPSISFYTADGDYHQFDGKWDMIIAFPPCTYMSKAGACRMYPRSGEIDKERLAKAMEAKAFFMALYDADCKRVAIENPTPLKCVGLPKESQVIQPYQFGEPYSKRTLLWLKGLQTLTPTREVKDYTPYVPSNTSKYSKGAGGSYGAAQTATLRSKTFPGIAKAMAEQWAGINSDK